MLITHVLLGLGVLLPSGCHMTYILWRPNSYVAFQEETGTHKLKTGQHGFLIQDNSLIAFGDLSYLKLFLYVPCKSKIE